jgi:hypothetical protein
MACYLCSRADDHTNTVQSRGKGLQRFKNAPMVSAVVYVNREPMKINGLADDNAAASRRPALDRAFTSRERF